MPTKKVIFFFYNRFRDPLLQSNIFQYINAITKEPGHQNEYAIVTFEDKNFPLTTQEIDTISSDLKQRNIHWHQLKWHEGDGIFLKGIDLLNAFWILLKLRMSGFKYAVSLGSIAGSFLYIVSRIVPFRYYLYQYEPHSEYALDGKIWTKDRLQFKWLKAFESRSLKKSAVISSGTDHMRKRLEEDGITKPFFKITSVVNDTLFVFSDTDRKRIRQELEITEAQKLIIYPGKMGGLYANAERMAQLIMAMAQLDPTYSFLVITPHINEINAKLDPSLSTRVKVIPSVAYEKMPAYLSAADLGIVSVLPGESQKFRSNIKVGEFLCTGLPYLICKGVSEDDLVAEKYNVGVVVNDLISEEIIKVRTKIGTIISEPKEKLITRCREAGIAYRGFQIQNEQFVKAMEELTRA